MHCELLFFFFLTAGERNEPTRKLRKLSLQRRQWESNVINAIFAGRQAGNKIWAAACLPSFYLKRINKISRHGWMEEELARVILSLWRNVYCEFLHCFFLALSRRALSWPYLLRRIHHFPALPYLPCISVPWFSEACRKSLIFIAFGLLYALDVLSA